MKGVMVWFHVLLEWVTIELPRYHSFKYLPLGGHSSHMTTCAWLMSKQGCIGDHLQRAFFMSSHSIHSCAENNRKTSKVNEWSHIVNTDKFFGLSKASTAKKQILSCHRQQRENCTKTTHETFQKKRDELYQGLSFTSRKMSVPAVNTHAIQTRQLINGS